MKKQDAKKRIQQLKEVISEHRYNYHVLDKVTMSEAALDSLKHELFTLEQAHPELITSDSPTQRVGGEPLPKFEKIQHQSPMLSMEDVFTKEELEAWITRIEKHADQSIGAFFCMPKLDGLAVSLIYKNGMLETAATRGNGAVGENITQNVKTIESIPLSLRSIAKRPLPEIIEVRGEIYFPTKEFEKLNKQLEKEGKPTYANPRNTAAGSVRQLDPAITATRKLAFVAWDLEADFGHTSIDQAWELLASLGFRPAPESNVCSSQKEIEHRWELLQKKRDKLGYWIDGMVIRVNDIELYQHLGVVGKTPRGLIAWKFPAEEATTIVRKIQWTVGRTGALTPVAVVEPTWIGGTTVQHASLHNIDEIRRLDVREGDTVILYKAGDIIPKIKHVLTKLRPKKTQKISIPTSCPVCGSNVHQTPGEVAIYCENPRCFVQDRSAILHAARAFGIDGIGPQTIGALLEQGIVSTPPDLFMLEPDELLSLEGFGETSAHKLVDEIQSRKSISLPKFLLALGMRNVGEQTAVDISHQFNSLEKILSSEVEEFMTVEGVGEVVAQSIRTYLDEPHHREMIQAYLNNGIVIQQEQVPQRQTNAFSGKTLVITGTFSLSRDEIKERIREVGGKVSGSVSAKTDFVLVGENPGSKLEKAEKLEVKTLSEEAFLAMLSK